MYRCTVFICATLLLTSCGLFDRDDIVPAGAIAADMLIAVGANGKTSVLTASGWSQHGFRVLR